MYLAVLSGGQDGSPPSLTTAQSRERAVLERGRWMEGEFPCLEVQGLTGGHWLCLGWGKLAHISAPKRPVHTAGHWCPRSLGGPVCGSCPRWQLGNWSGATRAVSKGHICYKRIVEEEAVLPLIPHCLDPPHFSSCLSLSSFTLSSFPSSHHPLPPAFCAFFPSPLFPCSGFFFSPLSVCHSLLAGSWVSEESALRTGSQGRGTGS